MSDIEFYEIANSLPREYENLLKDIKHTADAVQMSSIKKQKCKLLMRYLDNQWREIKKLKEMLKEEKNGSNK